MATDSRRSDVSVPPPPVIPPAASGAATISNQNSPVIGVPIVFKRTRGNKRGRKGRNRKKRYARGTKQVQRLLLGLEEAAYRATNGASRGLQTFVRRSKRSRRRRKDGLIRDQFRNAGRGFQRALRVGARAPWDIGRRVPTRPFWRTFRNVVPIFFPR